MKILLLGSGGREHALAWKIAQSAKCEKLYIAPGNAAVLKAGVCAAGVHDEIPGGRHQDDLGARCYRLR